MYAIKDKETGRLFCGWHMYSKVEAGVERWAELMPYFDTYPTAEYATRAEVELEMDNLGSMYNDLDIVKL